MAAAGMKFLLIWAVSASVTSGGMSYGVATRSQEFSTQEKCEVAKAAILKWKDKYGIGGVSADCLPE